MHVELPRLPLTFVPNDTVALVFEARQDNQTLEELGAMFRAMEDGFLPKMAIIFLEPGSSMRALDERQMRECGWVRG